jgi:nucleotide-binding universal stress UspA family protein
MLRPTKILVPTDFSEYSDKALKQGLDIARQYKAKVYLFHVIPVIQQYVADYAISGDAILAAEKQAEEASAESMKNQLGKFPHYEEVEVITDVAIGMPSEAILKEADGRGIDLIVIASLGRSGIAKYLIGGVARNVLKGAKCPVLLTK